MADYRVEQPAQEKRKRSGDMLTLNLVPNPDIVATMGLRKRTDQITVGFAAETHDVVTYAQDKLTRKHLDLIVANEVGVANSGFGSDTSRAWILAPSAEPEALNLLSKTLLAEMLFQKITTINNRQRITSS